MEATGAGAEAPMAVDEAARQVQPAIRTIVGNAQLEPQTLVAAEYDPRPTEPRARIAQLTLEPGASFRPPTGACQDVLLLVRSGELRAVGSGIAPPDAPATLYAGDAVRFGAEADGLVQNLSEERARSVVAFVRARDSGAASFTEPGPLACEGRSSEDALRGEIRSASLGTTPALSVLGGKMRVRILLDEEGAGARHGGLSLLEADPDVVVPEHRHAGSAEILFVERGGGVLRIGERRVRLRPGAAVYVPEGELHSFTGEGDTPFVAVQVYTPSGPEQRFR